MKVIPLSEEHKELYFVCLEDWSDEMKEAGDHKRTWYRKMAEEGLRVQLALDDDGRVGGMIQYLPIELSYVEGRDLYFIPCIWVHGHKQGRGDFRGRGMGVALLSAAENDVRALGGMGMVAWGMALPVFIRASWFKKHGYRRVDRDGIQVLLWKPFSSDAVPPKWIAQKRKPAVGSSTVTVTAFVNGWCPAQAMVYERARRAAESFGDSVAFEGIDTSDRDVFLEWGISDGLFIDGKSVRTGPPPSYEKIEKAIAKRVKRRGKSG